MDKCPITGLECPNQKCIHATEISNFQAKEVKDMCINCGLDYISKEGGSQFTSKANQFFHMINEAVNEAVKGKIVLQSIQTPACPTCGHTPEEIVLTGKLGCGNCYDFYKKELLPLIEKCQSMATKHVGKTPKKNITETLEKLENDLKETIKIENYEKAAALRDKIKKLQSGK